MVVLYSNLLCAESVDVEVLIQMLSFYPVNASYLDIFLPSFPCEGLFNLIFKKDNRLGYVGVVLISPLPLIGRVT